MAGYEIACLHCIFIWIKKEKNWKRSQTKDSLTVLAPCLGSVVQQKVQGNSKTHDCMEITLVACLNSAHKRTCKRASNIPHFHCILFLGQSSDYVQLLPQPQRQTVIINFILHLFLSSLCVLSPSLCYSQRLLKCSFPAVEKSSQGWGCRRNLNVRRSGSFCHPNTFLLQTWWCHWDLTQWVVLISVSKPAYLNIYLWKKEGKGIFKLNVKISAGKHL